VHTEQAKLEIDCSEWMMDIKSTTVANVSSVQASVLHYFFAGFLWQCFDATLANTITVVRGTGVKGRLADTRLAGRLSPLRRHGAGSHAYGIPILWGAVFCNILI
jgi:hypothetical protein